MTSQAWGLLGGTFDPPHLGHLAVAEAALTCLNLAEVHWIPAGRPPHRRLPVADAMERLAMVRLLVAQQPSFVVETMEVDSVEPSYSVDTLSLLRAREGTRPLVLLLGVDAFSHLHTWHMWNKLFDLTHIAVATRQGYPPPAKGSYPPELMKAIARRGTTFDQLAKSPAGCLCFFDIESPPVSATQLRTQIKALHASSEKMPQGVTAPVWRYICQHRLYGKI